MRTHDHLTQLATNSSKLSDLDQAMTELLQAIGPIDEALLLLVELVEAWGDLDFDDRRYLGTAFPRLINALIRVEDQLR